MTYNLIYIWNPHQSYLRDLAIPMYNT